MKATVLVLSCFVFSFGYSQEWQLMFKQDGESYFFRPHTTATAWVKLVSESTEYYPTKSSQNPNIVNGYQLLLWKFDCSSKKIGIIQKTIYSKDGKVLNSYSENELLVKMEYVIPDSIGERMLENFCVQK